MPKKAPARVKMIADHKTERAAPGTVAHVKAADVAKWEDAGWIALPTDLQPEPADD